MTRPRQPLFVARETVRRRRLTDTVRVLPLVGLFLLMLPMLWATPDDPAAETASEGLYIFAVWGGLIVAAFVLSRLLAPALVQDDDDADGG